jgi:superfamily II DNA or RNA helicase
MTFFSGTTAQSRDYQERICAKVLSMVQGKWVAKDGHNPGKAGSVLIEAPTGSGKTVMGLGLAQWAHQHGLSVGWCAMRRNLLTQALEMRDQFGFDVPDMQTISMFQQDPPEDLDWLFVDEAQHDSTDSMAHIHGRVRPKVVIGLSATPYRTDRAQLSFERIVKDVGIHTLIQEGWLSQFDHYTITKYTPETVAELFQKHPGKWGKSVAFFLTMEECQRAQTAFQALGITNELVWGGSNREEQIESFRAGDTQVLISMSILSEGFDAEDMQSVFIRPSSKLPAVQMGGRVLRKCAHLPIKQIIQCMDTNHPFVKTARARTSYIQVGDNFRSLNKNENVDRIARDMAKQVLMADAGLPDFILKELGNRNRTRTGFDLDPEAHVVDRRMLAQALPEGRGRRFGRRRRRR